MAQLFYSFILIFLCITCPINAMFTVARRIVPLIAIKSAQSLQKNSIFIQKNTKNYKPLFKTVQAEQNIPMTQNRLYSWFSWTKTDDRSKKAEENIKNLLKNSRNTLLKTSDTTFDEFLKNVATINYQSDKLASQELVFEIIKATGYQSNSIIAPWFYNDNDIAQELIMGVDRQKRLAQVLLNKKIKLDSIVVNNQSLLLYAISQLNIGFVQMIMQTEFKHSIDVATAIYYLASEFAKLEDKNNWLCSYNTAGLITRDYHRARAYIIKMMAHILQPEELPKFNYNGPTSDNVRKSQNNQKNNTEQKTEKKRSTPYSIDEFYQFALQHERVPELILGIEALANQQEIKNAYKALISKYHPDKYLDDESRRKATIITQIIINAYKHKCS
ncbi:MAG: J domain-containing protein [Candidatus Dependentiae bacterium]